jgi:hypothetical protein
MKQKVSIMSSELIIGQERFTMRQRQQLSRPDGYDSGDLRAVRLLWGVLFRLMPLGDFDVVDCMSRPLGDWFLDGYLTIVDQG